MSEISRTEVPERWIRLNEACWWLHPLLATAIFGVVLLLAFTRPLILAGVSLAVACTVIAGFVADRRKERRSCTDDGCTICSPFTAQEDHGPSWLWLAPAADVLLLFDIVFLGQMYTLQEMMGHHISSPIGAQPTWTALFIWTALLWAFRQAAHARADSIKAAVAAKQNI